MPPNSEPVLAVLAVDTLPTRPRVDPCLVKPVAVDFVSLVLDRSVKGIPSCDFAGEEVGELPPLLGHPPSAPLMTGFCVFMEFSELNEFRLPPVPWGF